MFLRILACWVVGLGIPAGAAAQTPDSSSHRVAIRAARLIDGRGGAPIQNAVILIDSTRITSVGSRLPIPSGTKIIDLGKATILPGLIDCHTHITGGDPGDYYQSLFRRSPIDYAVAAPTFARRTLEAGLMTTPWNICWLSKKCRRPARCCFLLGAESGWPSLSVKWCST